MIFFFKRTYLEMETGIFSLLIFAVCPWIALLTLSFALFTWLKFGHIAKDVWIDLKDITFSFRILCILGWMLFEPINFYLHFEETSNKEKEIYEKKQEIKQMFSSLGF